MKKVIIASNNQGKIKEFKEILKGINLELISMREAGIEDDVDENGTTFEENAIIKAKAVTELTGEIAIADDSGLVVDYLNGEPGIYSARFMGHDTPYSIKNAAIIEKLKDAAGDERSARFVCAIACTFPDGKVLTTCGTMEGVIGCKEEGTNGFGYDPIVVIPQYGKSSAQLTCEEKNAISHRGEALRKMQKKLAEMDL